MKLLILATDYPNLQGKISLFYIHTRCKYYVEKGLNIEVLNFSAKEDYVIDGVKVITLKTYKNRKDKEYELLVSHAPNLRNHYKFIKKYNNNFKKQIFFFHGHEVLKLNKDYSKPYNYMKKKFIFLQDIYDSIKLRIWHNYFLKYNDKCYYIFVSNWMKEMFLKNTKIKEELIKNHSYITYNSIGEEFEKENYDTKSEKKYDFITIRGNLDGSKYCIDIVNQLAFQNPKCKFLIVGKGKYFDLYEKAPNIERLEEHCSHEKIIKLLNKSKCALMPTRTDAQGLMACEIATFGIPLITSNIPVCHEIFDTFSNVEFVDNNNILEEDIINKYQKILNKMDNKKNEKYFLEKNCNNEMIIFEKILQQ